MVTPVSQPAGAPFSDNASDNASFSGSWMVADGPPGSSGAVGKRRWKDAIERVLEEELSQISKIGFEIESHAQETRSSIHRVSSVSALPLTDGEAEEQRRSLRSEFRARGGGASQRNSRNAPRTTLGTTPAEFRASGFIRGVLGDSIAAVEAAGNEAPPTNTGTAPRPTLGATPAEFRASGFTRGALGDGIAGWDARPPPVQVPPSPQQPKAMPARPTLGATPAEFRASGFTRGVLGDGLAGWDARPSAAMAPPTAPPSATPNLGEQRSGSVAASRPPGGVAGGVAGGLAAAPPTVAASRLAVARTAGGWQPVGVGEKVEVEVEIDPAEPEGDLEVVWAAATVVRVARNGDFNVLVTEWESLPHDDPLYEVAYEDGPYKVGAVRLEPVCQSSGSNQRLEPAGQASGPNQRWH